jgi:hypothetical protein
MQSSERRYHEPRKAISVDVEANCRMSRNIATLSMSLLGIDKGLKSERQLHSNVYASRIFTGNKLILCLL